MAIAVHPDTVLEQQQEEGKKENSLLDVSASDYWFKNLRPYIENMLMTCRTDEELIRTLERDINAVDTVITREQYNLIMGDKDNPGIFVPLTKVISSSQYFITGPLRRATEKEKDIVRGLQERLDNFALILQFEKVPEKEEPKTRERLNYSSNDEGIGYNNDFASRNMSVLNKPNPKPRIPNV